MVKVTKIGSGVTIKEASIGRKESRHFSFSKLHLSNFILYFFLPYGSNIEFSEI